MRIDRIVVDSSPLIALFRSGREALLPMLFSQIAVPDAVWCEVVEGGHHDAAATRLKEVDWAMRLPRVGIDSAVQSWGLGAGESAVLTFATQHPDFRAAVDDAAARRCARSLGIATLGMGGILLLAKRRGLIASLADELASLQESGLWLGERLIDLLLQQAGER